MFYHYIFSTTTKEQFDFIDLTDLAQKIVQESKIKNGLLNIQSLHTTVAIIVNENEPLLISDMKKMLDRLIPQNIQYQHDNFEIRTVNLCNDECANGHAHCKAILLGPNKTLNIINGKIELGQWQRIFAVELDRSRPRKIALAVLGE